jgi:hypothetical protein
VRSFKDSQNREWTVDLSLGAIRRLQHLAGLTLLDLGANFENGRAVFERLSSDVAFLCDVLTGVCLPQIKERGLTEDQFADALDGAAIDQSMNAFLFAWSDFLRGRGRPSDAELILAAIGMWDKAKERSAQMAAKIASPDFMDALMKKLAEKAAETTPKKDAEDPPKTDGAA